MSPNQGEDGKDRRRHVDHDAPVDDRDATPLLQPAPDAASKRDATRPIHASVMAHQPSTNANHGPGWRRADHKGASNYTDEREAEPTTRE